MSMTITFSKPIEFGEEVIPAIELREATLGDLEVMDKHSGMVAKMNALISQLSGQAPSMVKMISARDLDQIQDALGNVLPASLATGET